ncbi:L-aspartate oxidase [Caproiciproducens galactitolivorans]|uniref:L-aspartate oxidase n=1 Tax=Caproiciproducens galactitolivorans TaxID=642589 RepID=A0A4Z0YD99_9FIRM|nr:L-aspartate oxidase [Caproiciproducens galactitolivorans]QEY34364.1 L-aspartate oxidase [Caproiciproducens galactitolivorans]TGJ77868.1 L-aspartate oxidase [Caproiciproducens galactitolivorans]
MNVYFDVLIVGTGAAGMYAALNLRQDLKVLLITKAEAAECNSYLAQGGIAVARDENDLDSFVEDTLKAGKYENNVEAVKVLARESRENINQLIRYGVEFDREHGDLQYTREGAHRINRIVHCKDQTGKKVTEALYKEVKRRRNITVFEGTCLIDILRVGNTCCGGIAVKNGEVFFIHSKFVLLASGGIGGLFKNSTNYCSVTGDGIAIALKNGIKVKNLNYIQIHPTAFYEEAPNGRRFLISEAVRGEGGKLINKNKERFVDELLPRDVVSKKIFEEEEKTHMPYVGLDITFKPAAYLVKRFPGIYRECLKKGVDITRNVIPVTPAQHYFMGGIEVDLYAQTSMKNLFACGEVSCTGVHGANRLASNSLLEALVFSRRAAKLINSTIDFVNRLDAKAPDIPLNPDIEQKRNREIAIQKFKEVIGGLKSELVSC